MWDEIILLGQGYAVFHDQDAVCFESDGRRQETGLQKSFDDRKNTE